jgi:hypothetical protein
MESMTPGMMRCPTCRATQPWSDVCRRCKSDLVLLRELAEEYASSRQRCLANLRDGRIEAALDAARQCIELRNDADAQRLAAVCELLAGDWSRARSHASELLAETSGAPRSDEQRQP